jgi:hypothetical protein
MTTVWAFDTETYLIRDNDKAPKPVVASWYNGIGSAFLTLPGDAQTLQLWSDPYAHYVGHNIAYDLGVLLRWCPHLLPFIVRAVDEGRVWDTQVREQLLHLASEGDAGFPKRIGLDKLELKYLQKDRSAQKKGDDVWRLKYGTLDGVPLDQWPVDALNYALEDAVGTWQVFHCQGGPAAAMATESLQVQAALSLHLISVWGSKTNQDNVSQIKARILNKMAHAEEQLSQFRVDINGQPTGIVGKGTNAALHRVVLDGWAARQMNEALRVAAFFNGGIVWEQVQPHLNDSCDLGLWLAQHAAHQWKNAPAFCYDRTAWNPNGMLNALRDAIPPLPRSTRGPKTGEDEVTDILEYVPILKVRAEYKHQEKMLGTYVTPYEGRDTIHPSFNAVVSTGRTSCEKPNMQNIPRGEGFRRNVHARPGYLYGTVDYSALEMVTFAATIRARYGQSQIADAIDKDMDLHCMTASGLFGIAYERITALCAEEKKAKKANRDCPTPHLDMRQGSKALNFGGCGGLGPKAFQPYARFTYGVEWTLAECRERIRSWKANWPEIKRYLDDNSQAVDGSDGRRAEATNNCGRKKANCIYTQLCNYPFQSLAADGVKASLWEIVKHCLLGWYWTDYDGLACKGATAYGNYYEQQYMTYHNSPLRGSHPVNMVHDEIVVEHPQALATEAFALQQALMRDTMGRFTHGVKVGVEGMLGAEWEH